MRKLRLSLEELAVETFETTAAVAARGTVQAHGPSETCPWLCGSAAARATCYSSCTEDACPPTLAC